MSETATTTEPEQQKQAPSVAKASGSMAIATIVSRATGLLSKVLLIAALGAEQLNTSYQAATTLPTMINELLLGGVLTSVAIPLLVRAEKEDGDGGESYAQWLISMGTLILGIGTIAAVACAPLLTDLFIADSPKANPALVTAFAYLVLPGIVFYGLTALLSAVLNARHVFGLPTWAPVLNNVVMILVLVVYWLMPGEITLNPVHMTEPKLLVLGIGTALGVAIQALVLIPALMRTGFRFKWRFGWDSRLSEFGGLAFWVLLYVGLGFGSMTVLTNVATHSETALVAFNYQWLIAQVPYGVLGVSLLTALMPKMSRSAANNDNDQIVRDLLFGNRMSSVLLMPFSVLMTVSGVAIGVAAFGFGKSGVTGGTGIGLALALSAFGLVPYAITLLQLRVFYAMKDARTPTYIQALMVAVRIGLLYFFLAVSEPEQLAVGVSLAMSLSFVFGAVVGQVWLRIRLGRLRTGFTIWTVCLTVVASALAFAVAKGANALVQNLIGFGNPVVAAWAEVVLVTLIGLPLSFGLLAAFRVPEMKPAIDKINRLVRRR
ncbi:murein biosynthesis integral membrane protein MurJ [Lentzea aerocolonigenes]|uniref:murein biosynthesis integral membrane protein MurJ n=1 Tax=Lentzea aerocolonigenes TaxID=68170 RepID=UPI0004C3C263|nr:murein biosynthesis integral membrane protein MurJ [Lentzea aerocolonigenes]MCP2244839.1 putative peptidoglycan lipid II flippase [Lentzea aerocolonigenes]MCP2245266.1 putative peptidoglycan lipid II flippase [Lentzea aerocolonigenes]